jgi:signal peptidase I
LTGVHHREAVRTRAPRHETEARGEGGGEEVKRDGILVAVKPLLEIVIVAVFLTTFLVQPMRIPSESMVPTLRVGDFLLVDMQSFAPSGALDRLLLPPARVERGELAVFHNPVEDSEGSDGASEAPPPALLVKRVIGLPGDRLRLRDGRVLVDESLLPEPYAFYAPSRPNNFRDDFPSLREADPNVEPGWWIELRRTAASGELTVPPGCYFVLGDNRNDSEDSRYWGFVPGDAIVGRPLLVYFAQRRPEASGAGASLRQRLRAVLHLERHSVRVLR